MRFQKSIALLCLLVLGACNLKGGTLPSSSTKASLAEQAVSVMAVDAMQKTEPLSVAGNASYLQMGTFSDGHKARQLLQRTSDIGVSAYIVHEESLYHVKSGPYIDADQALRHKLDIDRMLDIEARVVFE